MVCNPPCFFVFAKKKGLPYLTVSDRQEVMRGDGIMWSA